MGLATFFKRKSAQPREPSVALINMRSAVDRLLAAVEFVETAVEAGETARLSCIGMTIRDAPAIGTAHRHAALDITVAMFGLSAAVQALDATSKDRPRPDEREAAKALLNRVSAIRSRMAEVISRASAIQ